MVSPTLLLTTILAATSVTTGLQFDGWSSNDYTGKHAKFTTKGTHKLGFTVLSYKYSESVFDIGCCIKFCRGSVPVGDRCEKRENPDVAVGNRFDKIVMGCGGTVLNC